MLSFTSHSKHVCVYVRRANSTENKIPVFKQQNLHIYIYGYNKRQRLMVVSKLFYFHNVR